MGEYANGAGQPLLQFSTVSLHRLVAPADETLCEWWWCLSRRCRRCVPALF